MIKPEFSEVLRCAESSVYIPEIEHRYKKNDALKKVDPPGKYGQLDIYMLNWLNFREVGWCCCFLFFLWGFLICWMVWTWFLSRLNSEGKFHLGLQCHLVYRDYNKAPQRISMKQPGDRNSNKVCLEHSWCGNWRHDRHGQEDVGDLFAVGTIKV